MGILPTTEKKFKRIWKHYEVASHLKTQAKSRTFCCDVVDLNRSWWFGHLWWFAFRIRWQVRYRQSSTAVKNPTPNSKQDMTRLLGVANYLQRFATNLSSTAQRSCEGGEPVPVGCSPGTSFLKTKKNYLRVPILKFFEFNSIQFI